ncbi:RTA1 like protein family [Thozetella sp. PMI_491]|nr:RTA1 like protein family [Thozetella sp. PMI_491]
MAAFISRRSNLQAYYPDLCAYDESFYLYRIDIVPNAVFLALFGLSFLGFAIVYLFKQRHLGFTTSFLLGTIAEIIGYTGRILSWMNQWDEHGFMMQICCLTIGPAFMNAGIYFCLRGVVYSLGPSNSRLEPRLYPLIFIPCDIVSIVLQAVGGAMAAIAAHKHADITPGDNVMISGLSFQSFTLLLVLILSIDFSVRAYRHPSSLVQDQEAVRARTSWQARGFLCALSLSAISIFIRSVFRVAELSRGWTGQIMREQNLFVGFEGVLVVIAVWVLNIFHPSFCPGFMPVMGGAAGVETQSKMQTQDAYSWGEREREKAH